MQIIEYIISSIGQLFSANSITKYLKHDNINTTPTTIINYMNYLVNSFLIYQVKREDIKLKKKLQVSDKYYVVDPGFYYLYNDSTQRNIGQILENIVFLELKRRDYRISVGRVNNEEVDFICRKNNNKKYIQVSLSILDPNTHKRELKPLKKINDNYPKYVITEDPYDLSEDGIIHMNIIDFLKSDEF